MTEPTVHSATRALFNSRMAECSTCFTSNAESAMVHHNIDEADLTLVLQACEQISEGYAPNCLTVFGQTVDDGLIAVVVRFLAEGLLQVVNCWRV